MAKTKIRGSLRAMGSTYVNILFIIAGIIGLYYLYIYLFTESTPAINVLSKAQPANAVGPTVTTLPPLYQGGQISISTWVYINNFAYSSGYNAPILILGGPNFDTLRVYLGTNGQLCVRVGITGTTNNLRVTGDTTFTQAGMESAIVPCDVSQMDLQRWVCIVVVLNGKLCDVYMDGKLVRSCSLDNYFNVDTNTTLKICPALRPNVPGFGGVISSTNIYGTALGPDIVYKNYMAGPVPILTFYDYLLSFFLASTQ